MTPKPNQVGIELKEGGICKIVVEKIRLD